MRDVEHAPLHLLQQLPEVVVVEGESTNQEGVQDDPARPHVGASSVVLLALPKGGEMRRATAGGATGSCRHAFAWRKCRWEEKKGQNACIRIGREGSGIKMKVGTEQGVGKGGTRYRPVKYISNIHFAIAVRMEPVGKRVIIVTGAGNGLVNQSESDS